MKQKTQANFIFYLLLPSSVVFCFLFLGMLSLKFYPPFFSILNSEIGSQIEVVSLVLFFALLLILLIKFLFKKQYKNAIAIILSIPLAYLVFFILAIAILGLRDSF
jgi:hypothetical protein